MPGKSSRTTPKKQSTLTNKKALNLKVVEEKIGDVLEPSSTSTNIENIDVCEQENVSKQPTIETIEESPNNSPRTVDLTQPKVTLTIKQKQSSPKTPKSMKTLKMKDDTKSSKKKKTDSVKRKRGNDSCEEVIDIDESHFISTRGKQTDEIIGSVASIFLTKEQRQRKKEIETLNEQQKNQEKRKEINSIFCVQGGEHPLMKLNKERKKDILKESKSQKDVDLSSWQGVEPLSCNITSEKLREFGFCQNVGFSQLAKYDQQFSLNIDDLLLPDDSSAIEVFEYQKSYENHPNTPPLLRKLTQYNQNPKVTEKLEQFNLTCSEKLAFEQDCTNLLEESIEGIYPKSMWKECKRKGKQLFKKSLDRKFLSSPMESISKIVDLDGETSLESTNSIDGTITKKDTLDDLWSIKYKPNNYDHIISKNENSNQKLREWLEKWKTPPSLKKKRKEPNSKKRKIKKNDDDLFTDEEYEDDEIEKSIILYGATSGKSSSLFAIATQLGYEIMEVNSACDRSSKSIMELKETTQSKGINSIGKIIVFEDADLKFREESYSSFIAAIEKLEKSTKRPIILISDNLDEQDLLNSVSKQKIDYCCRDPFTNCSTEEINQHCKYLFDVSIYISSIMLCEGIKINVERDLLPLVAFFEGDLKKILLHLQFWFAKTNTIPRLPHLEFKSPKSLLEKVIGLDNYYYERTIDKFRHAEDDFELMSTLDFSFFNYLNNLDRINSDFISTLSQADTLRKFNNELSCKIYSTIEILAISTYLHEKSFARNNDSFTEPINFINSSSIPLTRDGTISRNRLIKFKSQLSHSFLYSLVKHIINRQEYVCLHPSNYLYQHNMTEVIHHLFGMCNSENQRRENASRRRFFHYLKTLVEDEELQMLEMLAKSFE